MLKINLINHYDDSIRPYKKTIYNVLRMGSRILHLKRKRIINVILVDNHEIHEINRQYRQIDRPTDVISFENDDLNNELGDVFISIDQAKEQAVTYGHSFERELAFLTVHGFLHCNGYDHLNESDEKIMFDMQDVILNKCKIAR